MADARIIIVCAGIAGLSAGCFGRLLWSNERLCYANFRDARFARLSNFYVTGQWVEPVGACLPQRLPVGV